MPLMSIICYAIHDQVFVLNTYAIQHQPDCVITGFLPSTTLTLLVLFFLTVKQFLILLTTVVYSRNYPYIQQTPHLSRYLNLISAKITKFMLTVNDTLMMASFVEFLKNLFQDLFYFVFLSKIFSCILLAIEFFVTCLRMRPQ